MNVLWLHHLRAWLSAKQLHHNIVASMNQPLRVWNCQHYQMQFAQTPSTGEILLDSANAHYVIVGKYTICSFTFCNRNLIAHISERRRYSLKWIWSITLVEAVKQTYTSHLELVTKASIGTRLSSTLQRIIMKILVDVSDFLFTNFAKIQLNIKLINCVLNVDINWPFNSLKKGYKRGRGPCFKRVTTRAVNWMEFIHVEGIELITNVRGIASCRWTPT